MSRPIQLPLTCFGALRLCPPRSARRYAKGGVLGRVSEDARGRSQVPVAAVEAFFNVKFTDEELAQALATPERDKRYERKKIEKLRSLIPPPLTVNAGDVQFLSKIEAEIFARNLLAERDRQYGEVLAKLLRIPTRIPLIATAARSRRRFAGYVPNKSRSAADDLLPERNAIGGSNV